jgi:hypothetical protein
MSLFKTRAMIADEYGIHRKTLERKIKQAGLELPSGNISPKSQQVIYEYFGSPPFLMSHNAPNDSSLSLTGSKKVN